MVTPVTVVGSYISPYVRKVLVFLELKGIPYEIDPIIPFFGGDEFSRFSPVRRVPVFIDDLTTLTDSSVICQYLEDRYPSPALYPADIVARATARWFEEYADTRMGDVFIWRLFNEVAIHPYVWGRKPDKARLAQVQTVDIPEVLDYLEGHLPAEGWMFSELSIADIAIGSFFRNVAFARVSVDATRWPKTAAFVERVLAQDCFRSLAKFEELSMRTPIPRHRAALEEAGAPLTAHTWGTAEPRPGVLPT